MKTIKDMTFGGERPLFESHNLRMENITISDGESAIKECTNLEADGCKFYGKYPWWHVDGTLHDGTYPFMGCRNVEIDGLVSDSKYVFQYVKHAVIRNAKITTKDSFWETEDITVYDSVLDGEYLGWHSKNLRLVRCHIAGEQPLCYAENLVLEDCTFDPACDRAFKNPTSGHIVADSIGSITLNDNVLPPADCKIETRS